MVKKKIHLQFRNCRQHRFDPWVMNMPARGHAYLLQYSCMENSMDREAWLAVVHSVTKSWTQLK